MKKALSLLILVCVLTLTLALVSCNGNNSTSATNGNNISYVLSGGTMDTDLYSYDPNVGILEDEMPVPTRTGYKFAGWYTTSHYAEDSIVKDIPKGMQVNYHLYAKWEIENYEITYNNVPSINDPSSPNNTNPTSYNIEKTLKVKTPEWSGLVFTHWTDSKGNTYTPTNDTTTFPENMSGGVVLTANWKVNRNVATPAAPDFQLYTAYVSEDGFIYFFYDLGTIEHVVLDETYNDTQLYYKNGNISKTLTLSNTVTISEDYATTIANTVSKSISSSTSWDNTINWAHEHTTNWNAQIGGGVEGELGSGALMEKILNWSAKAKVEGFYNWGAEDSTTDGWTHSDSGSNETTEGEENTVTTSIAYKKEITSTIEETYVISADLPNGYYAYVHAGNIRVIAVVTYETATGNLYLNTYSRLDNMHVMPIYYPDVNQLNNPSIEGLNFSIPSGEAIENYIENAYYVNYDANGGEGEMLPTMHTVNGTERLAPNAFTKTGYTFVGWMLSDNADVIIEQDGASVTNIGEAQKTITLKALWTANKYTIEYNSNSGMGEMENSNHIYDENSTLNENKLYKTGYHFVGWNTMPDGSGISFFDKNEVYNITNLNETITLYAQWSPNIYTITWDLNGGDSTIEYPENYCYGIGLDLSSFKIPSNGNKLFLGWYDVTNDNEIYIEKINPDSLGNKIIQAKWYENNTVSYSNIWEKSAQTYDNGGHLGNVSNAISIEIPEELKKYAENGQLKINISATFNVKVCSQGDATATATAYFKINGVDHYICNKSMKGGGYSYFNGFWTQPCWGDWGSASDTYSNSFIVGDTINLGYYYYMSSNKTNDDVITSIYYICQSLTYNFSISY